MLKQSFINSGLFAQNQLILVVELGLSEVNDFHFLALTVIKNVGRDYVSVHDALLMDVLQLDEDIVDNLANLWKIQYPGLENILQISTLLPIVNKDRFP
jgi:hypothetical protein